jgi:hypothetical protein
MKKISMKCCIIATVMFFLMSGSVAATVKISSLPKPSPTAKLRVFVVVVTSESKSFDRPILWAVSPEDADRNTQREINEALKQQGFYEVVSSGNVQAVLGNQTIAGWEWVARDWALAKDVGKALHADYVILFERSVRVHLQQDVKLVNLNTGKQFESSGYIPKVKMALLPTDERARIGTEAVRIHFRKIFNDAKSDLLQTAILKGKLAEKDTTPSAIQPPVIRATPDRSREQVAVQSPQEKPVPPPSTPQPAQIKVSSPEDRVKDVKNNQLRFERELEKVLSAKDKKTKGPRLVVYDFDTVERMKVVGLILTEALREELFNLGGFVLVNRESILKIMDEYKLQQTSLVDEKQVVEVGKWLAANEAVTGNLAVLGKTSILQVKRVDIKTLGTVALGSVKCTAGREDELLDKMPELARKLAPLPK